MSPGKHRRHQPAYSAGGDYSLPDSPARHSRSGGSSYGSPSKSLGHQSPAGHQQRRLQRQLARRVHGVLPPEQRYMPPSSRKGTDDAARRALIAHLKEVDEAMDRINKGTRSRRPHSQTQRLKARQTVSMPVSPLRRERAAERDAAPPPYAPQLQNKAVSGRQQPSFEVHANASSHAPSAQFATAAPQSQPGLPKLVRQNAFSGVAPQARSAPGSVSPSKAAGLTRRASGLPTIKESHVSLAALLSAPARLSPDKPAPRRSVPQQPGLLTQQDVDDERRRRSEARLNARLSAHPGVMPAHPGVAPAAHTSAARALWPDSAASSPERLREGTGTAEAGGRPDAAGVSSAAAAADEPTPPRAVPAAALWAQPPAPLPHSQLPQGPFAFSAPGSVRRYSSPAASPPQWRPMRSAAPGTAAGRAGTGVPAQPPAAASTPADVPVGPAPAAEAAGGGDGSDWEDAGRWLEPDAPGATAALRTALAALAAGTPPKGSGRSRRRNASAPGSRHTSAPGSPTAGSRRPSFTQPLPWTPAGAPGTDRRRWFEQITEADGAPLSLARRTPLPRRPLDVEPSMQPAIAGTVESEEEEPQAMPSNLAGLLEAASDDAAEPAAGPDSAPALPLPGECLPEAAPVEDQADVQHLAAGRGNAAGNAAEEPQPKAAEQQDNQAVQLDAASVAVLRECPLPDEMPDTSSSTDGAERSSGSSSPAEPAAEPAAAAEAVEAAAPHDPAAAAAGFATALGIAAGPEADTSGHRRRRWRRIAPRPQAPSPSPPGTAPASPLQRSPRQLSPAPLTGTTRAPGSPEPHVASATKRPRISPPPGIIATADAAASAPATPEQPQPRSAMAVPPFVLPEDAAEGDPPEQAAKPADDSEQMRVGTAAPAAVQVAAQDASHATAAAAGAAQACSERQPAAAPSAEEPAEISATEAAAEATAGGAASGSPPASSGKHSEPDEQLLPPETVATEAGSESVMAPEDDYVSNFNEDMNEEEDLTPSSGEDLASSSTVDSTAGAEAAAFQAAAAAAAARAAAAASPPWSPSDDGSPDKAQPDAVQPSFPGGTAPQDEGRSPGGSSLSSVFEDEAEASFQLGGFTPFAPFSPFTPALAAAAAAAEAGGEEERDQAAGGARLRFSDPPLRGGFTSEIEPADGPAEQELAAAETAVTMPQDMPNVPTCSTHHIGAALLELQPGMASAPAGEVAAAVANGVAMHKAWIHAAKQPASGSNRTICWKVAGGEVMLSYQRGLMRRNVSTVMYRVYLLDNNALAVDTAQGVLILRMPDAALHAMVVLGINAALALASGQARKSTAVADLPWSADIMLDDSIVE